jgi:DNA-binding transcriptional regulator YbjK
MATPDLPDRVTLLERLAAQHAERLDRLDVLIEQQQHLQVSLRGIVERLAMQHLEVQHRMAAHDATVAHMAQTLDAIKDLLDRGNGH